MESRHRVAAAAAAAVVVGFLARAVARLSKENADLKKRLGDETAAEPANEPGALRKLRTGQEPACGAYPLKTTRGGNSL